MKSKLMESELLKPQAANDSKLPFANPPDLPAANGSRAVHHSELLTARAGYPSASR
jgi:hypothetical protein